MNCDMPAGVCEIGRGVNPVRLVSRLKTWWGQPQITICILTMNRVETLKQCFDSLLPGIENAPLPARLLVLDQHSRDGTLSYLTTLKAQLRNRVNVLASDTNLGCAGGRHAMAAYLMREGLKPADCVAFLDDDIVATSGTWVEELVRPILAGQADITGYEGWKVTDDYYTLKASDYDYVGGGRCAVRGAVFLSGCTFDLRFNPKWWEDVDFCLQAQERGYRIVEVGHVGLYHESHGTSAEFFLEARQRFIDKWPPARLHAVRARARRRQPDSVVPNP